MNVTDSALKEYKNKMLNPKIKRLKMISATMTN
jgi:hypothetical protein